MITGKIVIDKDEYNTFSARTFPATPWNALEEREDDYAPYRKMQESDPPIERKILVLFELNNKTLPEQGWTIGTKVIRDSQATIKPVGTIIGYSFDPIRAFDSYKKQYQSLLVKFSYESGRESVMHYAPSELIIIDQGDKDATQDNQDQQKAG